VIGVSPPMASVGTARPNPRLTNARPFRDISRRSLTIELRPDSYWPGFQLPADEILPASEENYAAALAPERQRGRTTLGHATGSRPRARHTPAAGPRPDHPGQPAMERAEWMNTNPLGRYAGNASQLTRRVPCLLSEHQRDSKHGHGKFGHGTRQGVAIPSHAPMHLRAG